MFWLLISIITLLSLLLSTALYFLFKFTKIIFVFEDDLSKTIEGLENVEKKITSAIELQVYFDSPEVQRSYVQILEELKLTRAIISEVTEKFVQRSKRKYIIINQEEPTASEYIEFLKKQEQAENSGVIPNINQP